MPTSMAPARSRMRPMKFSFQRTNGGGAERVKNSLTRGGSFDAQPEPDSDFSLPDSKLPVAPSN
jgi:hypothetical protein